MYDDQQKIFQSEKKLVNLKLLNNLTQTYAGESLLNNLHGYGFYVIEKENQKIFYDGLFYANKLEGYSQIFYQDGSNFHGLFKDNRRFGPGIFTYPTGEQDVGLWNGFSIVRLASSPSHVFVSKLSQSNEGNVKTLKYRNLVPMCVKKNNRAEEVLQSLGANEKDMLGAYKLYNQNITDKNHVFFNKKLYDNNFFEKQDCCIDILVIEDGQPVETISEFEENFSNDSEIARAKLKKLDEHIQKLDSLLREIESRKEIVLSKLNYCKNCCNISEPPKSFEKSNDVVDIKVPETQINFADDHSLESITFSDLNFITPVSSIEDFKVSAIETYLEKICVCQEAIEIENLSELEKQLDFLLTEETFHGSIRDNMVSKLQYLRETIQNQPNIKTKKIVVDELLAWNNEQLLMDMLKHSFLHRESEKLTTVKVSAIIGGHRKEFSAQYGRYEKNCIDFLTECSLGSVCRVIEYLRRRDINVNVSDSFGNNGIFYAVTKCRNDMIRMLVNFGGNLDQINDEGLTPLNLAILSYLSKKYNIKNWETSFLSQDNLLPNEQVDVMKWHLNESFLSLNASGERVSSNSNSTRKMKPAKKITLEDMSGDVDNNTNEETYFFEVTCKSFEDSPEYVRKKSEAISGCSIGPDEFKDVEFPAMESTINTLLECGANPNAGEAPLPPLIMSIFSENSNLVKKLLDADADIHVVITGNNLTCFHIIAASSCTEENANICSLLSQYSCDPNAKTDKDHWPEQKLRILGSNADTDDNGKNPLHILCLRQDFETDYCNFFKRVSNSLIESGIDINATYLGLNALSLAILSGNSVLVENLLSSDLTDPYQFLDPKKGNILTLLFSEQFKEILPVEKCIEMIKFLVEFGVSPLQNVGEFENAIGFVDFESIDTENKKDKQRPTSSQKNKNDFLTVLNNHLKELTREMIIENIKMKATENLYNLAYTDMLKYESVKVLAEYLTPEKAIENLKLLFNYGKLNIEQLDKEICLILLDYINNNEKEIKQKKKKKSPEKRTHTTLADECKVDNYKVTIENINFHEIPISKNSYLLKPGLDDPARYNVCFECLLGRNKELTSCIRCQWIKFCSIRCNKLNLKRKNNQHICSMNVFEKKADQLFDDESKKIQANKYLETLCKMAHEKSNLMVLEKKNIEMEKMKRKEEEEKKLDIYGTRYLHKKKCGFVKQLSNTKNDLMISNHAVKQNVKESLRMSSVLDEKLQKLSYTANRCSSQSSQRKKFDTFERNNKIKLTHKVPKKKKDCICPPTKCDDDESMKKSTSKTPLSIDSKFEPLPNLEEPYLISRKIKKIPRKQQYFMEILTKYFPNMDLSYLLLPYICYSNGHLYYQFMDENGFWKNYSTI
ncbi:uncharacterized protein isoform X1 [Leptinotarsa decemlineata]|uniref:uncharacterized protein isoform X1 n=1 Tax=Leptinotarsa decemlineata TaxID=7539 RepID=UPI003D30B11F